MPIERQPEQVPEVNPENEPFVFSPDQLKDALALQIVTQTFSTYESYRTSNYDRRWNEADALYLGFVPAKVWDGTTIPRANLPVQISFDQVESAFPVITQALFSDDNWFETVAEPGTSAIEAQKAHGAISYVLDHSKNDYGLTTQAECSIAIKDILKYGNGGVWLDWDAPKSRPITSWVDIRDVYVDPACPTPNIDESRCIIRRRMLTVQDIEEFRSDSRMKIPSDAVLWSMAKSAPSAMSDSTRQAQEALRNIQFAPSQADWIPNPADRKIEMLMYYSKSQIVWVLNRQHVMYNARNPYGFIPAAFAPCYPVNGHFYGQGIPEVQRGNQRMIEGLLNGHLDETSLALHPPRTQKQSSNATNNQRKWGPGFVQTVADAKDVQLLQPQQVTQNVMSDVAFIMEAAEKRTGIGAMAQGLPRGGNANRTATGMNIQSQGAVNRIQPIVKNIEDYLLVPLLRKIYKMMSFHLGLYDKAPAKANGTIEWVEGWNFQRPCDFKMLASSKMLAKANLMQIFPFVTQYLLSGPLIEALKANGQSVDFSELLRMLQDAAGTEGRYDLIRPMTEAERQQAQQPPPQIIAQQQSEAAKHQSSKEIIGMKIQGDLQKAMIAKQGSPEEAQIKMAESQQKMEMEQMKAQIQMALQQQRLEFDKQMAQMKLQVELKKGEIAAQSAQQKLIFNQQSAQQKVEAEQQKAAVSLQTAMMGNQQSLRQSEESHQLSLRQQKEANSINPKPEGPSTSSKPRKKAEVNKKARPNA